MPRSSARAYVEPIAALAAVFALGLGLTLYAGALDDRRTDGDRRTAATVLDAVLGDATELGVVSPGRLRRADVPAGWSANLTVVTPAGRWTYGDPPPPGAERAERRVSISVAPGEVRPGRLRVAVWR